MNKNENENKVYYGEYSLKHWIDLMLRKNIILPPYQRIFVWNKEQVIKLIKSFKDKRFVPPVIIAANSLDNSLEDKNKNWILDGQQRLTSLLLAYFNVFPDKKKFENPKQTMENIAREDDATEDEIEGENPEQIQWQFSEIVKLVELEKSREEIQEKLNNDDRYTKLIDENIKEFKIIKKFKEILESTYLGFSYLVPSEDRNYYSDVFVAINTRGVALSPLESRQALYYLDKGKTQYFDPEFTSNIKINNQKIDFVRMLSFLSEYEKNGQKVNSIATGHSRTRESMEKYYENYIHSVINDQENPFPKFINIFEENMDEIQDRYDELKSIIQSNDFSIPKKFDSIIDFDIYFLGLVYWTIFKGKELDYSRIEELKSRIDNSINEMKTDNHKKSPNCLKYMRSRVKESIAIYQECLKP